LEEKKTYDESVSELGIQMVVTGVIEGAYIPPGGWTCGHAPKIYRPARVRREDR
jgi:hypothetical protein